MKFTTAQIITVGTGIVCCPMGEIYEILNFLTGDMLFTHQLPRACRACEPWVIEQHPWLKELDASQCNPDTVRVWLANACSRFGAQHELKTMPAGRWTTIDPIKEAGDLMGDKPVVVIAT